MFHRIEKKWVLYEIFIQTLYAIAQIDKMIYPKYRGINERI
jgi:hypothetical protein